MGLGDEEDGAWEADGTEGELGSSFDGVAGDGRESGVTGDGCELGVAGEAWE